MADHGGWQARRVTPWYHRVVSTKRSSTKGLFEAEHGYAHCIRNKLCRECGGPITGRRKTWCSDECVNAYKVRSDPTFVRRAVFERDQGVCARCDLDTETVRKAVNVATSEAVRAWKASRRATESVSWVRYRLRGWNPPGLAELARDARKAILVEFGLAPWWNRKTFWDADHVVAVHQGGGECDLDNYQTLCVRCHQARSSHQARRRARRSKGPVKIARREGESYAAYTRRVLGRPLEVPQRG